MKRIITYFMQGVVFVAPLAITVYIIFLIFDFIDGLLRDVLESWLGHIVPGLGLLVIVVLLTLLGLLGEYVVFNPFRRIWERLLGRAPLLKVIYTSLVDLFSAFVGKEKKFNSPVLVCINKENQLWKIGFLTQKNMDELELPGMVAVYFPHSYAFSGELFMVETSAVKKLDMPPAEAMKFVVSGGVTRVN
ncbi:DUF502 domain-containing protein [Mangrovibacterium lignilyticum]|uniref:DUF502 domain-containing protein n=1 Tax=Mangrovibacterium lignilyticum TaxID=2668052 RepID=UPI0013D5F804|nr:DUF502 domain-containing protein [Mangrovibacterium lignilyticum]